MCAELSQSYRTAQDFFNAHKLSYRMAQYFFKAHNFSTAPQLLSLLPTVKLNYEGGR
jgi:hypothetical protein